MISSAVAADAVLCDELESLEKYRFFFDIFRVFAIFPKNMFIFNVGRLLWKIEVLEMAKNAVYKGLAEATS